MYIREIFSNMLDMKGSYEIVDYILPPNKNETAVFVGINEEIQSIVDNWHDYFADKTEVLTTVKYGITQQVVDSIKKLINE